MPNEFRYFDVEWQEGTPIAGERLATNGYYTGEHIGTVMQDKKVHISGENTPHWTESEKTIRLGTIMQDAADKNFPDRRIPEEY